MAKRNKVYKALTGVNEGKIGTYVGKEDGRIVLKFDEDAPTSSYLPTDVQELETLDLTPSWPAVLNIYLAVLDNKKATREGRQAALDGLRQMAQVAQIQVDLQNRLDNDEIGINLRALLDGKISQASIDIVNDYDIRNKLIDEIENRLKENAWIGLSDGTTFEKTFVPEVKK